MSICLSLFLTFAKIGLFTFGGGYAMISLIADSCVERKHWITHDEMMNITVLAESTPGPIAINCATYVGHKQAGIRGAAIATLGIVLPSFLILYGLSLFMDGILTIPLVANAFKGIKIAVGLLILDAACTMIGKMQKKPFPLAVMLCSFVVMLAVTCFALRFSTITLLLLSALVSLVYFRCLSKGGEKP